MLTLVLMTFIIACEKSTGVNLPNSKDSLLIYLMAGQSNMAGRGIIEGQDINQYSSILSMNKDNEFVRAREPLHFYQPNLDVLSCGTSFAKKLRSLYNKPAKIGMIPCAVGSSSMEEWLYDSVRVVALYTNLLLRAKKGRERGVLQGILWHQGEADASDSSYKKYQLNLTAFVQKVRNDLAMPELPFIIGKLPSFNKDKYRDSINIAIERTAQSLQNVYVIETADLTGKADSLHFDAPAQRRLGERFAVIAVRLIK